MHLFGLRWKLARKVRLSQHQRSPGILKHVREALSSDKKDPAAHRRRRP